MMSPGDAMKKTTPRLVSVKDRNGYSLLDTAKPAPCMRETLGIDRRASLARLAMAHREPAILPMAPLAPQKSGGSIRPVIIMMALALAFLGGIAVGRFYV